MHKIKKGIKKKIKGKKKDNDEIFTEEELENYKKRKEEEAHKLAEEQQQPDPSEAVSADGDKQDSGEEQASGYTSPTEENNKSSEATGGGDGDWRNFLAATDTVLKETTEQLDHIKEESYFQKKPTEAEKKKQEETSKEAHPEVTPAAATTKWADWNKGLDEEDEEQEQQNELEVEPEPEPDPEPVELKPLDIDEFPEVDLEEYTEDFDTTFIDELQSGKVKLHYIPDSPTFESANEPDPFDTSEVDKVLHKEEPQIEVKKVKTEEKGKKKIKLVSLGCAVDVLSGKQAAGDKSVVAKTDSKRRRVIPKEVNLLGDDEAVEVEGEEKENLEEESKELTDGEATKEPSSPQEAPFDPFGGEIDADLPEVGTVICPSPLPVSPRPSSPTAEGKEVDSEEKSEVKEGESEKLGEPSKEVDLSEFLDAVTDEESKSSKEDKSPDLTDLVAEFDVIDKSEIVSEDLIPASEKENPIEDEFDLEFSLIAETSVAKQKFEDELENIGKADDDPFDTSEVTKVLGSEVNTDPFDVSFADTALGECKTKPNRPPPARPALPSKKEVDLFDTSESEKALTESADPFDTSAAENFVPADPFETNNTDNLPHNTLQPDTLKPQAGDDITKSESFDPFDTTIAEGFGKTELKVLESELLPNHLADDDDDFDFDPRAGEEPKTAPCLLTCSENESTEEPVLKPSQDLVEDFDPFDTSIAAKVAIKTLEDEFLPQPSTKEQSAQELTDPKGKQPPPRPVSPSVLLASPSDPNPTLNPVAAKDIETAEDNFDPFDTSIADKFGKTELQSLENELLTTEDNTANTNTKKPQVKPLSLKPVRPASPACLLAATPLDDNPTLQPVAEADLKKSKETSDDFDPFDTSIAENFGTTELKALESELLEDISKNKVEEDDFNPREEVKPVHNKPTRPARPASPAVKDCLLTATPTEETPDITVLAPSEVKLSDPVDDFDPFDTSIAVKFGKTELKNLEDELLTPSNIVENSTQIRPIKKLQFDVKESVPLRPPQPQCLLATTPVDQNPTLQPLEAKSQEPKQGITPEDFDPFDTSIAQTLVKTEIKDLEKSLLEDDSDFNPRSLPSPIKQVIQDSTTEKSKEEDIDPFDTSAVEKIVPPCADRLLAASPNPDLGPVLKPQSGDKSSQEIDPFDTSIADQFGKTELKALESELLTENNLKRDLEDDDFDPRAETKAQKSDSPKTQAPPINLLDSTEDSCISDQPIQITPLNLDNTSVEYDPFDTSIAADVGPGKAELKRLETELLSETHKKDPFDTSIF